MGLLSKVLSIVPLLAMSTPVNDANASTAPTTEDNLDLLYYGLGGVGLVFLMRVCCYYCSRAMEDGLGENLQCDVAPVPMVGAAQAVQE